jgi:multidrug resistance efflux pump
MLGVRQQQAQRKAEQAQVDAHNAEHCGPLWDQATDHTQRLKPLAACRRPSATTSR